MNFFDITVTKNNNNIETLVYRKPTYSGLLINFDSFSPFSYKISLIKTIIYKAYNISLSFLSLHLEIDKIIVILINNGFKRINHLQTGKYFF